MAFCSLINAGRTDANGGGLFNFELLKTGPFRGVTNSLSIESICNGRSPNKAGFFEINVRRRDACIGLL